VTSILSAVPPTNHRRLAAFLMALGLGTSIVACGDDDSSSDNADETATDVSGETVDTGPAESGSAAAESGFAPVTIDGDDLPELPGDDDPAIGMRAPSISGTNYDGEPVSFTPGDRPTLLVFLAHWCPHCNAEIPMMLEWKDAGGVPEGLDIIAVSTSVDSTYPNFPPGEWLADKGWTWPVIADDEAFTAGRAFGLSGFPFMVLVDAGGNVAARTAGQMEPDDLSDLVGQVAST
jgi:cytochrome c biogenesis protein CcmG/thiol:disulfide interchange protein DsbE